MSKLVIVAAISALLSVAAHAAPSSEAVRSVEQAAPAAELSTSYVLTQGGNTPKHKGLEIGAAFPVTAVGDFNVYGTLAAGRGKYSVSSPKVTTDGFAIGAAIRTYQHGLVGQADVTYAVQSAYARGQNAEQRSTTVGLSVAVPTATIFEPVVGVTTAEIKTAGRTSTDTRTYVGVNIYPCSRGVVGLQASRVDGITVTAVTATLKF